MSLTEADLERIGERISLSVSQAMRPIERRLSQGDADIAALQKEQAEHARTLYGNGKPGIEDTVKELARWKASRQWFSRAIMAAVIVVLVGGAGTGLVFLIKLIP